MVVTNLDDERLLSTSSVSVPLARGSKTVIILFRNIAGSSFNRLVARLCRQMSLSSIGQFLRAHRPLNCCKAYRNSVPAEGYFQTICFSSCRDCWHNLDVCRRHAANKKKGDSEKLPNPVADLSFSFFSDNTLSRRVCPVAPNTAIQQTDDTAQSAAHELTESRCRVCELESRNC